MAPIRQQVRSELTHFVPFCRQGQHTFPRDLMGAKRAADRQYIGSDEGSGLAGSAKQQSVTAARGTSDTTRNPRQECGVSPIPCDEGLRPDVTY